MLSDGCSNVYVSRINIIDHSLPTQKGFTAAVIVHGKTHSNTNQNVLDEVKTYLGLKETFRIPVYTQGNAHPFPQILYPEGVLVRDLLESFEKYQDEVLKHVGNISDPSG